MNRGIAGVAKITGALAAAGGMIIMAVMPAAAAAPNEAWAASATGRIHAFPRGLATYPGISPVAIAHANIPGLLTTGPATDKAGPTSASSTVRSVFATLAPRATLAARTVSSSCRFNTRTGRVRGTAYIWGGTIRVPKSPPIYLAAFPARNSSVWIPGLGTAILNKQSIAPDGTLRVTAIYVYLLHGKQTLSLGVSVCNAADLAPVPMLPSKALPFTLGGLAVLFVVAVSYRVTRRGRFAPAA